ncbi:MAG TPA: hypothetical protein VGQ91_02425, partial [Ideonella sp.]|nr:hypothetical protein [Ideonella sp.]
MPSIAGSARLVVAALVVPALPLSASGQAAASAGQFCGLREVPPEATTVVTHGVSLRIFPDARAVEARFSGCQSVWLANGFLLAQATYRNGEVVKYVGNNPDGSRTVSCLYEARRLVASAGDCPPFEDFP